MEEVKWYPIGEVAKQFDINVPRLRTWCDKGLIENDKRSNARYIPDSEFEKIQRIKALFDHAEANNTKITYEDIQRELKKDHLFVKHEKEQQQDKANQLMEIALNRVIDSNIRETFEQIAAGFVQMQEKVGAINDKVNQPLKVDDSQTQMKLNQMQDQMKSMASHIEQLHREKEEENRHRKESEERVKELTKLIRNYVEEDDNPRRKQTDSNEDEMKRQLMRVSLRDEAERLWIQKPASERQKKTGFFGKEEDLQKKDLFIQDYINAHLEKRLRHP